MRFIDQKRIIVVHVADQIELIVESFALNRQQTDFSALLLAGIRIDFLNVFVPGPHRGYWCELLRGSRPCCGVGYIVIENTCVNAPFNDELARTYMCKNVPGETTFLLATRGAERWIVGREDTPLGPMLVHQFGPFAWADISWLGPHGVQSCACAPDVTDSPWLFADQFLFERWEDLQSLTRSLEIPASAAEYLAAHPNPAKELIL